MRVFVVSLVLVALGIGAWLALSGDDAGAKQAAASSRAALQPDVPEALEPAAGSTIEGIPFDRAAPDDAPPGNARLTTIKGRCIAEEDRAPLAGVRIALEDRAAEAGLVRRDDVVRRGLRISSVSTGSDGRFVWRRPLPSHALASLVQLRFSGDGRVPASGLLPPEVDGVIDCGDVPLFAAIAVRGRVVDSERCPQPDVTLAFEESDASSSYRGRFPPQVKAFAVSAADGSFEAQPELFAARWKSLCAERVLASAETFTVQRGMGPIDVVVAADDGDHSIRGLAVDEHGAPVARAAIEPDTVRQYKKATAGDDGRFTLRRLDEDPRELVRLLGRCEGFENGFSDSRVAWGARDARVVLRRGVPLTIRVRDGATQEPVASFGVRLASLDPSRGGKAAPGANYEVRFTGRHEGGTLTIPVPRGPTIFTVVPTATAHRESREIRLEVSDGCAPQEVAVFRAVDLRVRVRRHDGRPVEDTKVELIRSSGSEPVDYDTKAESSRSGSKSGVPVIESIAVTDAEGACRFDAVPGERLTLRALGPGYAPVAKEIEVLPPSADIELVVGNGARLIGRLGPRAFLEQISRGVPKSGKLESTIFLMRGRGRTSFPVGKGAPLTVDGAFDLSGIPSGSWRVYVRYWMRVGEVGYSNKDLCVRDAVEFRGEETVTLDIDASALVESALTLRVTVDGEPWAGQPVQISGWSPNASKESHGFVYTPTADEHGTFDIPSILPGTYDVWIHTVDSWLVRGNSVQVPAATSVEASASFESMPLEVRLVASDGRSPVEGVALRLESDELRQWVSPVSDGNGGIRIKRISPGITCKVFALLTRSEPSAAKKSEDKQVRLPEAIPAGSITTSRDRPRVEIVLPAAAGY